MALKLLHTAALGVLGILFVCVTLSLANSLLWLAELIEEHTRTAKTIGKRLIYIVIIFHCMLYFAESYLPLPQIAFSIICHSVYSLNFRTFPIISLTSVSFMSSCVLAVLNHFIWFFHFNGLAQAARARESRWRYRHPTASKIEVPSFLDVSTFFVICVWLVPLFLFLSLTANENTLPVSQDRSDSVNDSKQRHSLFMSLFGNLLSFLPRSLSKTAVKEEDIIPRSVAPPLSPRRIEPQSSRDDLFTPRNQNIPLSPRSPSFNPPSSSSTGDSWVSVENTPDDFMPESPRTASPVVRKRVVLEPPPKRI